MPKKSKSFLEEIIEKKKTELSQKIQGKKKISISDNQKSRKSEPSSFLKIFTGNNKRKIRLIAEVKFASPTNPHLGSQKDLLERVEQYEQAGADALSIITEKYFFKGDMSFIPKIKREITLPILQKDFVIDPSQIYEAKENGADALLLIARLLDTKTLKKFVTLCFEERIEPVVEINDEKDFEKALATKTNIIAVNARDLETFIIDTKGACDLLATIPDRFIKLAFSGVQSSREVQQYRKAGAYGVLVGTNLMKAKDINKFIGSLSL